MRPAVARHDPEFYFGKTELCVLRGQPDRAGERRFAASAESKSVDCGDDGLAEILNEGHQRLSAPCFLLGLNGCIGCYFIDVRACDECFVACAGQNNAIHLGIFACVFEGGLQVRDGSLVQRIEHLRAVERDVCDAGLLLIKNGLE